MLWITEATETPEKAAASVASNSEEEEDSPAEMETGPEEIKSQMSFETY